MTTENHHFLNPVLNGFVGDQLAAAQHPAAIRMSFRQRGRDVTMAELGLGKRLQGVGRTVVVMVPGLMCDEVLFHEMRWQSTSPSRPGYGRMLEDELGVTVLYTRYNSGLHISENGRALGLLLQELVDAHGGDIERLVLVGHSMGGLVLRSAGYYAVEQQQSWPARLQRVILIGAPMQGSILEQVANLTAFILNRIGTIGTQITGRIIDERSNGIRDLRFGLMVEQDWRDHPYDERLFLKKTPVPPLPGVDYHLIAGTLSADEESLLSATLGDGLVSRRSATGRALFGADDPLHQAAPQKTFPAIGHFGVMTSQPIGEYVTALVRSAMQPAE
ncbi:MAG: alpha/beta fold hydrolase [bacterium]